MGLIGRLFGTPANIGAFATAVKGTAEVFRSNATAEMALGHDDFRAALAQYGAEFGFVRPGRFDRFVDGLNRLPRPALALGTLGLFVFAMAAPERFSERMQGLALVPGPLWWLLGAIVSFYFGARELHYSRSQRGPGLPPVPAPEPTSERPPLAVLPGEGAANAALEAWHEAGGR